MSIQVKFPGH